MPWHVVENHSGCPDSRPFAVVKDGTSKISGCHGTRRQANQQLRALYANEPTMEDETVNLETEEIIEAAGGSIAPSEVAYDHESLFTDEDLETFRELTSRSINDLPDSAFAYIEPGGTKDASGKTTPRSKRHFPVHDEAHARNALARCSQSPFCDKARPKILAAARKFGIKVSDAKADGEVVTLAVEEECPEGHHRMPNGDCMPDEAMLLAEETDGPFAYWTGVLAVEGTETGDGREFAAGSLEWPDPEHTIMPLMWQPQSEPKHNRSVQVGRITRVERVGSEIRGWGIIKLGIPEGRQVVDMMRDRIAGGVSVDVDSVKDHDVEMIYPEAGKDERIEAGNDLVQLLGPPPEKFLYHRGRLRGATLVALPAFIEAQLRLLEDSEVAELGLAEVRSSMVAAGGPLYPPRTWFDDPGLEGPTPWTIDEDGRVYGHLALWSTCHTTFPDRCITPPREGDFPYFMKRELATCDGDLVGVGQITLGTGHAELRLGAVPAAQHYDNTGTAVVDIACGEDRWGIWVAGAVRPEISEMRLRELRAASLSGDWRRIGGRLRLVAVLAVNVPGYPIPRMRAQLAADELSTMVAAGIPTEERLERYKLPHVETTEDGTIRVRRVRVAS
jgi:hypothetical protein